MRKNWKKRIALLLTASLVFSMNATVFADEVAGDEGAAYAVEEGAEVAEGDEVAGGEEVAGADEVAGAEDEVAGAEDEVAGAEDEVVGDEVAGAEADAVEADITAVDSTVSKNLASQNQVLLSDNTVSDDLAGLACYKIDSTYYIVYPKAIAYAGKKATKTAIKNASVKVYKAKSGATVSEADLISDNKIITTSFDEVPVKKAKIKASKGATVAIDGSPLSSVPAAKSCYISSIKLTEKTDDKALQASMKTKTKAIKAMKSEGVSANGFKPGADATKAENMIGLTIAIYPAYAGSDAGVKSMPEFKGLNTANVGTMKTKNGTVKSVQVTLDKKETLKPTKNASKKQTGLVSGTPTDLTEAGNTTKVVECDGNFFGFIEVK